MSHAGERIKKIRRLKGLTQTDIQKATGISSGNLSDIENGKVMPSSSTLISLSRELGVSIDWILTGEDWISIGESKSFDPNESIPPEGIELLSKFLQLTERERAKIEGMIELYLSERKAGDSSKESLPSKNTGRGEAAAKQGA